MNRLSSLITAGLTTGLSAAALGATAMAQGVFGGGNPAPGDAAAVQQVAEATTEATAAVAATVTESPAPRIVYVDKEPIVVTRQVHVQESQPETEGAGWRGGETNPSTPAPSPTAAPTQPRSATPETSASSPPPATTVPTLTGTGGVSTAGAFDDNGGATSRDDRIEGGDDREDDEQDDDDRDDDEQDDDPDDEDSRHDREDDDDDD